MLLEVRQGLTPRVEIASDEAGDTQFWGSQRAEEGCVRHGVDLEPSQFGLNI